MDVLHLQHTHSHNIETLARARLYITINFLATLVLKTDGDIVCLVVHTRFMLGACARVLMVPSCIVVHRAAQ